MRKRLLAPFLALALLLPLQPGCALVSAQSPPEWAWFDVVLHPGGGIPASLGYYGGAAAWSPVGLVVGGLLPFPADEAVALYPGHWLGTGIGLVLGLPFHVLALPFGLLGGGEGRTDAGTPPAAAPEGAPAEPPAAPAAEGPATPPRE